MRGICQRRIARSAARRCNCLVFASGTRHTAIPDRMQAFYRCCEVRGGPYSLCEMTFNSLFGRLEMLKNRCCGSAPQCATAWSIGPHSAGSAKAPCSTFFHYYISLPGMPTYYRGGVIRRESGTFGAASTDSLSVGGVRDYNANFSIVGRVVKSVLNGQNDPTLVAILSHFSIVFSNVPFRQVSCHQRHSYFSLDSGTPMELPHTPAKCTHVTVRAC